MAIYHLKVTPVKRATGRSAVAASAYRAGERIIDTRTSTIHDYRRRRGVIATGLIGWDSDRTTLWNAAELKERHPRAIVAREIVIALPHELTATRREAAVLAFGGYLNTRHAVAVDYAIHAPTETSPLNWHCHLMLTTRRVAPSCTALAEKTRELDQLQTGREHIRDWRHTWAEIVNEQLWLSGIEAKVDPRSHKSVGADQKPLRHLGPVQSAMEARGIRTVFGDINRQRKKSNAIRRRLGIELRNVQRLLRQALQELASIATSEPTHRQRDR